MIFRIPVLVIMLIVSGCATTDYDPYITATDNQLERRSYQSRNFLDVEYEGLMRAVVGTLQDYHFRIREINVELGTITAFQNTLVAGNTELTIFIKPAGGNQYTLRINMLNGLKTENEPDLYQQFFTAVRRHLAPVALLSYGPG